jgi:tripartite-type tricarboxylate transporter receptor subunit TctC
LPSFCFSPTVRQAHLGRSGTPRLARADKGEAMKFRSGLTRLFALGLGLLALTATRATAQDFPNKPVKFIVCFAAGGPNDIVARLFGQYLSEHFKQQFVIENRPGAGGNIGMASGLGSTPDGYTIVFAGPNNFINATMYEKLPFEFVRDAAPISGTMKLTNVLVVNSEFSVKTLKDYIAHAKTNPGKMNYASGGVGTSPRRQCT